MSPFIIEAFAVGIKEGIKLWVVWLILTSLLKGKEKTGLILPFYLGIVLCSVLTTVSFFTPPSPYIREMFARLIGYTFFLFFLSSVVAIYQETGTDLIGTLRSKARLILVPAIAISTVFYFSPDIIGSTMFIREMAMMKEKYLATYMSGAFGFALPGIIALSLSKNKRLMKSLSGFFGISQFLLLLSILKLISGGIKGFAELSLLPAVQRGLMKFFHDVVHQTFVFLMVPDHPLLKITVWNFIGIFFGPNIAMAVTLILLLTPPVIFLYLSIISPVPEPSEEVRGAERRKIKSAGISDRRKKSVPVVFFIIVIIMFYFSGRGETISRLYNPKPLPVIEDKGQIIIPLTDPSMNLFDGRLHKFSFVKGEDVINMLIVKKPDGTLSVCLDACEICLPEGYGQTEGYVTCIYCMTPIPIETLGRPGGCNPIPIKTEITEKDVRIDVQEVLLKWGDVKTGTSAQEAIK